MVAGVEAMMAKATHEPECSAECEYAQRRIPHHHTDWGACMVEFRRATLADKAVWDEMGVPEVASRKYVLA